jgi:hypothetical protein
LSIVPHHRHYSYFHYPLCSFYCHKKIDSVNVEVLIAMFLGYP